MLLLYCFSVCFVVVSCNYAGTYSYTYSIDFLETPVDHFSFSNNLTFKLRYLINDTNWKHGGPIFFYTGNEGDIELFAQNTGFMWEIAPQFNALLVFAEHRYYGKTQPFDDKSYSDIGHLGYLTSSQALADYIFLLDYLQEKQKVLNNGKRLPVVAFGGSYGGMLSAWIRLKYPYAITGAVASSAPIYQFQGLTECNTFSNIVSKVFKTSSRNKHCVKNMKKAWKEIKTVTAAKEGMDWLSKEWKLCKPLNGTKDVDELTNLLTDIYGYLAMINYPYPTNFLASVPAHPVRALCAKIDQTELDGKPLLTALGNAISIYTNYTGTTKCLSANDTNSSLGYNGWNFQACTEIVMPMCNDENNELFEPATWDLKKFSDDCHKQFGTSRTRDDLAVLDYGGKEALYSYVIFTNGLLDPWSPGGLLESKTKSVYSILMPDAAHHLDLRASNPNDPQTVVNARVHIVSILQQWLKKFTETYTNSV